MIEPDPPQSTLPDAADAPDAVQAREAPRAAPRNASPAPPINDAPPHADPPRDGAPHTDAPHPNGADTQHTATLPTDDLHDHGAPPQPPDVTPPVPLPLPGKPRLKRLRFLAI